MGTQGLPPVDGSLLWSRASVLGVASTAQGHPQDPLSDHPPCQALLQAEATQGPGNNYLRVLPVGASGGCPPPSEGAFPTRLTLGPTALWETPAQSVGFHQTADRKL